MRIVDALDKEAISSLELVDYCLCKISEADIGVLVVEVLGELCNAFGIGLGLKSEALALEKGLEFLVIGNDAIVDDGELPVGVGPGVMSDTSSSARGFVASIGHDSSFDVPVGMAVGARRRAVGGPAGVGDAAV